MIKLLLVDDQILLRDSLQFIIEQDPELQVIATASNGREAFEKAKEHSPDVVLMDIMMSGSNGIEGTKWIKQDFPQMKVLILTTFDDEPHIAEALAKGADGYLLKDVKPQELLLSIKNIFHGMVVMQKNVYDKAVTKQMNTIKDATSFGKTGVSLTERELSVVKLIVDGNSNKEISQELFLSEGTVKNIITAILEKLELRDRTQLAIYAIKHDLL